MVDATVAFAIQKLSDFLTQEVNIRTGVKDSVRWLKDELGYLQSSVRVAEEHTALKQEMDLIRQWINNVKDVSNDAVIILERFSIHQEEHAASKQGILDRLRSSICVCKKEANLYDIGKEIESLKVRVVEIKNRREEYGITNILATPMVQQRKKTLLRVTSFQNEVDVVGFEDDVKILLAELVREDPSLKVISIHGMGGLGKTTLASKLYHSSELSHYKSRAWVCVSQEYNIEDVLKSIIKSFMGHELDLLNMDEVDLLRHLRKLLQARDRFLAVIDDIWDIEAWESIKKAFPDNNNGSRVIITTRNKKVAQRVDDRSFVHQLRFLREDESWHLFCKRAKPTQNLEKLGKEMVSKCRGLPLAIVVLSGLLVHKKSYDDWSKVKDHIWRQLKGDSVEIQEILTLSYNDLSFRLRQCFLYLARFPEDHTFDVNKLKLLWIAEEFISEAEEVDEIVIEDVADDYLNELINRNMIQVTSMYWHGQVVGCRVHDLVRDLAIQKATTDKLLGVFDSSKQPSSSIRLLEGRPRHVIYNGIGKYLELLEPTSDILKLRSLAVVTSGSRYEDVELISVTKFKYVTVLDLTRVGSKWIPNEIGDLVFLKYLGLTGHFIQDTVTVPRTIGKLKKLQTLCGSVSTEYDLPIETCELKELRHLHFYQISLRRNFNSGTHQTKLQTLKCVWYTDWIHINTVNLTNLRTLCIRHAGNGSYTLDSIANLPSLQTFTVLFGNNTCIQTIRPLASCKCLKSVELVGKMEDPSELRFLPDSVAELRLSDTMFSEDPMPTLGSLSNLTRLDLNWVYVGEKMVCSDDAFPSLQFLKLKSLPNVEEWHVEEGALPSLIALTIHRCINLKMVPDKLAILPPIPDIFSNIPFRGYFSLKIINRWSIPLVNKGPWPTLARTGTL